MALRHGVIVGLVVFVVAAIAVVQYPRMKVWITSCRAVPQADQARYDAAMGLFARANGAVSSGNYSTASDILDMAISRLGNAYESAGVNDDTGLMLQAGRDKAAHFDFKLAARMKQSALYTRLYLFRGKAHRSLRCHSLLRYVGLG